MNASLADRCECGYETGSPAIEPHRVTADGEGVIAEYECGTCGRRWFTGWFTTAAEAS